MRAGIGTVIVGLVVVGVGVVGMGVVLMASWPVFVIGLLGLIVLLFAASTLEPSQGSTDEGGDVGGLRRGRRRAAAESFRRRVRVTRGR